MDHGRASPGRVEADLLLGFEHRDVRMLGQCGRRRQAGDAAADDEDVGGYTPLPVREGLGVG
jgi:hypothetical protein